MSNAFINAAGYLRRLIQFAQINPDDVTALDDDGRDEDESTSE